MSTQSEECDRWSHLPYLEKLPKYKSETATNPIWSRVVLTAKATMIGWNSRSTQGHVVLRPAPPWSLPFPDVDSISLSLPSTVRTLQPSVGGTVWTHDIVSWLWTYSIVLFLPIRRFRSTYSPAISVMLPSSSFEPYHLHRHPLQAVSLRSIPTISTSSLIPIGTTQSSSMVQSKGRLGCLLSCSPARTIRGIR